MTCKGSEVDKDVNATFSASTSTSTSTSTSRLVETEQKKSSPPEEKVPPTGRLCIQRKPRRVLKFTAEEDNFLRKGTTKHGFGQWTAILRYPDLKFQNGRTADSFKKGAELRFLSSGSACNAQGSFTP